MLKFNGLSNALMQPGQNAQLPQQQINVQPLGQNLNNANMGSSTGFSGGLAPKNQM